MGVSQINGLAADGFTGHQVSVIDLGGGIYGMAVAGPGGTTVFPVSITAPLGTQTIAASVATTQADGNTVTLGAIAAAAVQDAAGTVNAHLRGIIKTLLAGIPTVPTPKTILTATGSASSNTAIVALVTGKRIKVVAVSLRTSYSAGAIVPILTDGSGGTTIYQDLEQAISGAVSGCVQAIGGPYWLCATSAGNALYLNPNGQTVYYSISYFADDAS